MSSGRSGRSSCRNSSRAFMLSRTRSGGGGTKIAVPGRVPPIQFWLFLNSPGCLSLPRLFDRRTPWISRMSRRERGNSPAQPLEAMVQCRHVVRDLLDVDKRHPRRLVILEQEQVGQRRLSPLDLRRKHRLLAHVGVDEQGQVGYDRSQAVKPAEGLVCLFEQELEFIQTHRRIRREWRRNDRLDALLAVCFD